MILTAAVRFWSSMVTTTSVRIARSSCLRSRNDVVGASKIFWTSAPARLSQASSCSVSWTGRRACWASRSRSAWRCCGEFGLQRPFQGAGHQPVLRFHRVVLSTSAVGLEPGPFHGQGERPQAGGVDLLGVAQRLDGRVQRGRGEHREHLGQDPLLQPSARPGSGSPSRRHRAAWRGHRHSGDSSPWCRSSRSASSGRIGRTGSGPAATLLPRGRHHHRCRAAGASSPAAVRCSPHRSPSR